MVLKCLGLCRSKHFESKRHYPTVIEDLCHHFSLEDLRKSTNNFDKSRKIGRRGFSTVYKGCLLHNVATDSAVVAVKRMRGRGECGLKEFEKEIELLCQLRHPNLVSLIGFCKHYAEKIIVYEYMPNGSLHDHLRNREMVPLSWKKRLEICIGAARGLHYLHSGTKRTIIHRDIKPFNILLDSNMVPKISDFGLSLQGPLFTSKPKPIKAGVAGTRGFLAPENLSDTLGGWTDRTDVYSFGVVLIEVICAKSFFQISKEIELQREEFETPTRSEMRELPREREELESPMHSEMSKLSSEELESPIFSADTRIHFVVQRLRAGEIIDPVLAGKIAQECLEVYIDIIERCLKDEPNERPAMGEVEVELEHTLTLQQEADARNTDGDYSLLSPSNSQPEQEGAPISAWITLIDACCISFFAGYKINYNIWLL